MNEKRLLAIMAHPDDESLGIGGSLAKYAAEGVQTYLITATLGEKGWFSLPSAYPGPDALGKIRKAELEAAAEVLGLREVSYLGYMDGEFGQAKPDEVISQLVAHLRRIQPQVVITFDPNGYYGHPDHIAVSQFTSAAVVAAADPTYIIPVRLPAHRVSKLYYLAPTIGLTRAYQAAFGDLVIRVDNRERRATPWPEWSITTRVDTSAYWRQVWQAISRHRSQLPGYQTLLDLPESFHQDLWGTQTFYRAFSLANGGREEEDLFEGLEVAEIMEVA